MKKNALQEIKTLEPKAILEKVKKAKLELADLIMDKNMQKLADLKAISKKRKDMAQMLTVLKQKQLLENLEKKGEGESVN